MPIVLTRVDSAINRCRGSCGLRRSSRSLVSWFTTTLIAHLEEVRRTADGARGPDALVPRTGVGGRPGLSGYIYAEVSTQVNRHG